MPPTARFKQPAVVADDDDRVRDISPDSFRAKARLRGRDSSSVRRAAADRAAQTARLPSATRMRQPPEKAEQGCMLFVVVKAEPLEDRCRAPFGGPGVDIRKARLDLGDAGRIGCVVSASAISAARSVSAARTVSISEISDEGTSCATPPILARDGQGDFARRPGPTRPRMMRKSVVLPAPLRPTRPTLWPSGMTALASSNRGRPSTE